MTRRIVFALLLALAAAAYFVTRSPSRTSPPPAQVSSERRSEPHADIDDASRAALEKILEDADREQAPRR